MTHLVLKFGAAVLQAKRMATGTKLLILRFNVKSAFVANNFGKIENERVA